MRDRSDKIQLYIGGGLLVLVYVLWYLMFVVQPCNFWISMAISTFLLTVSAILISPPVFSKQDWNFQNILIGILGAVFLYFMFLAGNEISRLIIPGQEQQVGDVYAKKELLNPWIIGLLLLFPIGPGEEVFWRGYIQKILGKKYDDFKAFIIVLLLYTGVHFSSGNFMLIMAALTCGIFWGAMFWWRKSVVPGIISHALWDLGVFILFPIVR